MEKTTKEVLHTQGEWKFDGLECITCNGEVIADVRSCNHEGEEIENQVFNRSQEEAEANAELICKAVNERQKLMNQIESEAQYSSLLKDENEGLKAEKQKLLGSNRELIEQLNKATDLLSDYMPYQTEDEEGYLKVNQCFLDSQTAINNAKNNRP